MIAISVTHDVDDLVEYVQQRLRQLAVSFNCASTVGECINSSQGRRVHVGGLRCECVVLSSG